MEPFGLVKLQCPGDCVEDIVGNAVDVSFFQTHVPLRTHAGEYRDFFPAEARDPAAAPARRQANILGSEFGAARGKEFTDRGPVVGRLHGFNATPAPDVYGGRVSPPYKRAPRALVKLVATSSQ
jgi:hypothetical protein